MSPCSTTYSSRGGYFGHPTSTQMIDHFICCDQNIHKRVESIHIYQKAKNQLKKHSDARPIVSTCLYYEAGCHWQKTRSKLREGRPVISAKQVRARVSDKA